MYNLSAKKTKGLIALLFFFCSLLLGLDIAKAQTPIGGEQPRGAPGFGCVKLPRAENTTWINKYEIEYVNFQFPVGNQAPGQNISPQTNTHSVSCWKRFDSYDPVHVNLLLFYNLPSSAGRLPNGWRDLQESVIEHFKDSPVKPKISLLVYLDGARHQARRVDLMDLQMPTSYVIAGINPVPDVGDKPRKSVHQVFFELETEFPPGVKGKTSDKVFRGDFLVVAGSSPGSSSYANKAQVYYSVSIVYKEVDPPNCTFEYKIGAGSSEPSFNEREGAISLGERSDQYFEEGNTFMKEFGVYVSRKRKEGTAKNCIYTGTPAVLKVEPVPSNGIEISGNYIILQDTNTRLRITDAKTKEEVKFGELKIIGYLTDYPGPDQHRISRKYNIEWNQADKSLPVKRGSFSAGIKLHLLVL